jgi:hypothetical protein
MCVAQRNEMQSIPPTDPHPRGEGTSMTHGVFAVEVRPGTANFWTRWLPASAT